MLSNLGWGCVVGRRLLWDFGKIVGSARSLLLSLSQPLWDAIGWWCSGYLSNSKQWVGPYLSTSPLRNKTSDFGRSCWHSLTTCISRYFQIRLFGKRDLRSLLLSVHSIRYCNLHSPSTRLHITCGRWHYHHHLACGSRERLPTRLYLHKLHIRPLSSCIFWGVNPESSTHLFLSCVTSLGESGLLSWRAWLFHPGLHLSVICERIGEFHASL